MGIEVSAAKAVTINDQHEDGVDTSIDGNPTRGRFRGVTLFHVFSRNRQGRRDDGNPLIYALKARKGFTILPFWKNQLFSRAKVILAKMVDELAGFDYILAIPSSSPLCGEVAAMVSDTSGVPILEADFIRKRLVGEVYAENKANPPKMRPSLKQAFSTQLHAWSEMDPSATYQAKDIDVGLRLLFQTFELDGEPPDLQGARILVVDDIFASGSSLISVRAILQDQLGAQVSGLCFLSGS